jgi:hypothetical protein
MTPKQKKKDKKIKNKPKTKKKKKPAAPVADVQTTVGEVDTQVPDGETEREISE